MSVSYRVAQDRINVDSVYCTLQAQQVEPCPSVCAHGVERKVSERNPHNALCTQPRVTRTAEICRVWSPCVGIPKPMETSRVAACDVRAVSRVTVTLTAVAVL